MEAQRPEARARVGAALTGQAGALEAVELVLAGSLVPAGSGGTLVGLQLTQWPFYA